MPSRIPTGCARALYGRLTGRQDGIDWLNEGGGAPSSRRCGSGTSTGHHPSTTGIRPASSSRVFGEDDKASKESAYAYTTADNAVMEVDDRFKPAPFEEDFDAAPARLQAHYMTHSHFLPKDHVPDNADRLTMPVYIVQGRYDMIWRFRARRPSASCRTCPGTWDY